MANLDEKICIIGGGPAGLSAGMYLEKKGYKNYTILEKNDHVGGKCNSPHYNGRRYEMGAIMGVPSYYAVHDVEEFAGIEHDGPQLNRNYKNKDGKVIEPFEPKKNLTKIPRLLIDLRIRIRIIEIVGREYGTDCCLDLHFIRNIRSTLEQIPCRAGRHMSRHRAWPCGAAGK